MTTTKRTGSVRRRHARNCASRKGKRCRCSGSWQFRARTPGGDRIEQGGFPTREDADEALSAILREVARGTYRRVEPIGFSEFAERWLGNVRPTVREATHVSYSGAVKNHLTPYLGDTDLRAVTPETVRQFVAAKSEAKRPNGEPAWSPKTIANLLGVAKLVFGAAVESGQVAVSPAERVKPPRRERAEREIPTADELARACSVAGDPWALIFELLSWTGLRRGEALALTWGAIDLPAARIHVRASRGRYGEGAPKSAAGRRIVPLTPSAVAALRRHRLAQAPDAAEDGGRVFCSATGGPVDGDNLTRAWTRSLRKAGVRHMPLHSLRHLAASRMIATGASPKAVQAVIGHASIQLTYDTYGHLLPDSLDALAAGLGTLSEAPGAAAGVTAGDTGRAEGLAN